MSTLRARWACLSVLLVSLLGGCGGPGQLEAPVAFTGSVTDASGKPVKDIAVELQPLESGHPATLQVGTDGTFSGEAVPGKYAYKLVPGAKARTAPKGVPAELMETSMERTYQVGSSTPLEIKLP